MKFIEFAFRLGVIFAIFGFLWGIFQFVLSLLRGGREKTAIEEYSLKFVQYFFLVDVTFLFCVGKQSDSQLLLNELFLSSLILVLYFVGKLQNKQKRANLIQLSGMKLPQFSTIFNLKAEIASIVFAVAVFVFFIFYPVFAQNPISSWFYSSILDIESTPVFGFIFKVIGFFVLLGILMKILNGFTFLLSGRPIASVETEFRSGKSNKDDFDDFEEVN
ncbi:MAG: hypothetical protein V4622_06725 [Bacteroidota bacterium]